MSYRKTMAILGATAAAITGCASAGDSKKQAVVADHRLGEEVNSICFGRSINGWRHVDEDGAVLLEKGVNDWYYVKVSKSCRARDFNFAQTIGIESSPAGGCVTRGDVILVDNGAYVDRCFIRDIYEWDEDAPASEQAIDEEGGSGDS